MQGTNIACFSDLFRLVSAVLIANHCLDVDAVGNVTDGGGYARRLGKSKKLHYKC